MGDGNIASRRPFPSRQSGADGSKFPLRLARNLVRFTVRGIELRTSARPWRVTSVLPEEYPGTTLMLASRAPVSPPRERGERVKGKAALQATFPIQKPCAGIASRLFVQVMPSTLSAYWPHTVSCGHTNNDPAASGSRCRQRLS